MKFKQQTSDPVGHLITRDPSRLEDAGCKLAQPYDIFIGIFMLTEGNPCVGCAYYEEGKCPGYQRYHTGALAKKQSRLLEGNESGANRYRVCMVTEDESGYEPTSNAPLSRIRPIGSQAPKVPKARKRCSICGRKIRGNNHKEGTHHQQAMKLNQKTLSSPEF